MLQAKYRQWDTIIKRNRFQNERFRCNCSKVRLITVRCLKYLKQNTFHSYNTKQLRFVYLFWDGDFPSIPFQASVYYSFNQILRKVTS